MKSTSLRDVLEDPGGLATRERDVAYFRWRWSHAVEQDAFHNPVFDPQVENLRYFSPHHSAKD